MESESVHDQLEDEIPLPHAAYCEPGPDGALEGCAALAWSLPFYLSLTGLSTGGQAMLDQLSQHHLSV